MAIKPSMFNNLVSGIASRLDVLRDAGTPVTNELIDAKIDELTESIKQDIETFDITDEEVEKLRFQIGSMFNVRVGEAAIALHNPDLPRWFDTGKSEFGWEHWTAYRSMLISQGRSGEIIDANEDAIDDILDYSGDPRTPGTWARKGLVMGNVQSGKTQNYIGLINKAVDCGYKTIILLGGHLNDLRKQTQERVDEGVLGRRSRHLIDTYASTPARIGVGEFRENSINTGTTTIGDFTKGFADKLGFKLTGEDPVIFTVKKHTGVMERLHDWIKKYHLLDPENGLRLSGPLLLIDDEADYASINTKHHKEEVTRTNDNIRLLLDLFDRSTYIGYTATPFANIFIDPDENTYSDRADLFPSDFMIKLPVPDNYLGQDHFFPDLREGKEREDLLGYSPTIEIDDYGPVYELKSSSVITHIPDSLKEAVRAFLIVIAVRSMRGERYAHNTMLVNISHLKIHQNRLEDFISEYHKEINDALRSFSGLGMEKARDADVLRDLEDTFHERFAIEEEYADVFSNLSEASDRVKVWAINQSSRNNDTKELNYSVHAEQGLCAIVIGGHKLSRGLTLEGLSVSYFARNSKAYDTLMQMCRWFGYRPKYADLCRVYLPRESIEWYTFIASAIRELYQELELMSRREKRPSEFGLKVREHPGAMMITAKNKMGASESEVRSQDLWGQTQRRFRFTADSETNKRNLSSVRGFIERLTDMYPGKVRKDPKSKSLIISDVDYDELVRFIRDVELPEDDLGNTALINHLKKMKEAGLGKPRVVLFNQQEHGKPKWEGDLPEADRKFINSKYRFSEGIDLVMPKRRMNFNGRMFSVRSVTLANPDDEKLFLMPDEVDAVAETLKFLDRKPVSFDYLCSDARDFPGLIIYHFVIATKNEGEDPAFRLGHGRMPTIGYSVSLPRPENLKGLTGDQLKALVKSTKHSYQVNKVHMQLQQLSAYEEMDDDD